MWQVTESWSTSSFSGCRERRGGIPANIALQGGELRGHTAAGGRMLESVAGVSKSLQSEGREAWGPCEWDSCP